MMRYAFLCLFLATTVLGSAIKGREEAPIKGHAPPLVQAPEPYPVRSEQVVEQYPAKSTRTEQVVEQYPAKSAPKAEQAPEQYPSKSTRVVEQAPVVAEQKVEETQRYAGEQQTQLELQTQQKEEQVQQVREQAAPKGGQPLRFEARPQVAREELSKVQKAAEHKVERTEQYEQKSIEQREHSAGALSQQVELSEEQYRVEEQRRYEEPQLVQSLVQPVEQREEYQQQQLIPQYPVKSAPQPAAPVGEAEPYSFNYQVEGSSRYESGDTKGTVRGQYTLQGPDGSSRVVDYIADRNGFRAQVNTNEFGTQAQSPANVALQSSQPEAQDISLRLEGKTREFLNPPAPTKTVEQPAALPPKPDNWQVKSQPAVVVQAPVAIAHEEVRVQETQRKYSDEIQTASAKGERLAQEPLTHSELKAPQEITSRSTVEAHSRAPKALAVEARSVHVPQPPVRSGFQSATAHRAIHRGPTYPVAHAPAIPVRPVAVQQVPVRAHSNVPAPVVRSHVQSVHRSPVQYNTQRHPPSPVQGYRRVHPQPVVEQPSAVANSRATFYGTEEDHSNFERS